MNFPNLVEKLRYMLQTRSEWWYKTDTWVQVDVVKPVYRIQEDYESSWDIEKGQIRKLKNKDTGEERDVYFPNTLLDMNAPTKTVFTNPHNDDSINLLDEYDVFEIVEP